MPNYKEIVAVNHKINAKGGDELRKGDATGAIVQMSELDAERLNRKPFLTGCKYELVKKVKVPSKPKEESKVEIKEETK